MSERKPSDAEKQAVELHFSLGGRVQYWSHGNTWYGASTPAWTWHSYPYRIHPDETPRNKATLPPDDPAVGDRVYYGDYSKEEAIEDGDIGVLTSISKSDNYPYEVAGCTWKLAVKAGPEATPEDTPLNSQVGGGHYKDLAIQPAEYNHANNIPFIEGCIIKYATRWRDKGGIEDLNKIIHFTQLLIELEGKQNNG